MHNHMSIHIYHTWYIYYCIFRIYNIIGQLSVPMYICLRMCTYTDTDNSVNNCTLFRCCSWSCATWRPCLGNSQTIASFKRRKPLPCLPKNGHFPCVDSWLISAASLIFTISRGKLARAGTRDTILRYVAGTLLSTL